MRPRLMFEDMEVRKAELGEPSSVPDLIGDLIIQNELEFRLDEDDEIYAKYGRRHNSYPYPQFNGYTRELERGTVKTAVLENNFLKAVFLPQYGGRLWELWDKERNRNLLYTNDVIRFSNLAVRNAWFSGGVEWNIGVIGHSPFTTQPLFTAVLDESGIPVLRMYEYERVRQTAFQMDFWLGEQDRFLNARMRILNTGSEEVPMYWWSNIAVPEYDNGRIIVPARKAYTFKDGWVYKADVPVVDGVDITQYKQIPCSTDYFFDIPRETPKYIANVDAEGYGLLHLSTDRLQSRKLFTWGNNSGSDRWQEFLTDKAGRYLEIQGGVGKTQYGCIPMPPDTTWEWFERYGAVTLTDAERNMSSDALRESVTARVQSLGAYQEMDEVLSGTESMAGRKAEVYQEGSGFGALKNRIREMEGGRPLAPNLEFGTCSGALKIWGDFLETGEMPEPDVKAGPEVFMCDSAVFRRLRTEAQGQCRNNWYVHYQLGLLYFDREEYGQAKSEFRSSLECRENPWAYHALACVYTVLGEKDAAGCAVRHGILMKPDDLSYIKECFHILQICGQYEEIAELYIILGLRFRKEGRIRLYYVQALAETGHEEEAYRILEEGLNVDDLREGEKLPGDIWKKLHRKIYGTEGTIPEIYNFTATQKSGG